MAKKAAKPASKADERNIVGSNQVEIQDIENQAILIWEKNKGTIIGGIAIVIAAFLGFEGFKFMQRNAEQSLMESYNAAASSDSLAQWAADNESKPLGGFAFKQLGDDAYAAGNLAAAENYYRKATASAVSPISDAAEIALAVTLTEQGKISDAKTLLSSIANNPEALNQAEAQYRLALIAKDEGDASQARSLVESIPDSAFFWKNRGQALAALLPEA